MLTRHPGSLPPNQTSAQPRYTTGLVMVDAFPDQGAVLSPWGSTLHDIISSIVPASKSSVACSVVRLCLSVERFSTRFLYSLFYHRSFASKRGWNRSASQQACPKFTRSSLISSSTHRRPDFLLSFTAELTRSSSMVIPDRLRIPLFTGLLFH